MFAIIEDGSRQYQVSEGQRLQIDYRSSVAAGDSIAFDKVLLANGGGESVIGRPLIDGAIVEATVLNPEEKGEKLEIQKIRRRKNSRTHTGHRQKYTIVSVASINVPGLEIVAESSVPEDSATAEPAVEETAVEETEPEESAAEE